MEAFFSCWSCLFNKVLIYTWWFLRLESYSWPKTNRKLCVQILCVGSLEKQSADDQHLFPGSKLSLHPPFRMNGLDIFAACLQSVPALILKSAICSLYHHQTNSWEVANGRVADHFIMQSLKTFSNFFKILQRFSKRFQTHAITNLETTIKQMSCLRHTTLIREWCLCCCLLLPNTTLA